jgi:hypothetical protein
MDLNKSLNTLHFRSFADLMANSTKKVFKDQQENLAIAKHAEIKLQMMEEKIKNLEDKSRRLEAINQNFMGQPSRPRTGNVKEENVNNESPAGENPEVKKEDTSATVKILNEIKDEISKKMCKRNIVIIPSG